MGSQERRNNIHRMILSQIAYDLQHLDLGFLIQTVSALGFAGGDADAQHLIEESLCLLVEFFLRGFSGFAYGVENAAAGAQDVQIICASQFHSDLVLPVAAEDHVRMAVDQTRCDQFPFSVDFFVKRTRDLAAAGFDLDDDAVFNGDFGVDVFLILSLLAAFVAVAAFRRLKAADIFN